MFIIISVKQEQPSLYEYQPNIQPLEVNKDVPETVCAKKNSLTKNFESLQSVDKPQNYWKTNKSKKLSVYPGSKVLKRKISDSSSSLSGHIKRGPGRPKKMLKQIKEDDDNNNDDNDRCFTTEKRLKLDCSTKIKHKTSNSSSSDLSPPVLEPWSPFIPRKDSTRTPPTLSPISTVAKLSDIQKSSDDEKLCEKKPTKKRSTSSVLVCNLWYDFYHFISI